jgi:hypothetical protein
VLFSTGKKTGLGLRQKLIIGILFIGYVALLSTHSVSQLFDKGNLQDIFFYSSNTIRQPGADQFDPVTNQKSSTVHVKINRHFDTEKLVFIIPSLTRCPEFNAHILRPIFADHSYFVSGFLFTPDGRGPPCNA